MSDKKSKGKKKMRLRPVTASDTPEAPLKAPKRKRTPKAKRMAANAERKRNRAMVSAASAEVADAGQRRFFTDDLDTSRVAQMVVPWHRVDDDSSPLVKVFGADSPVMALWQRRPLHVCYLGLCYDPSSPFVLSYKDIGERKDMVMSFLHVPLDERGPLTMLTDKGTVMALMHILERIHRTKWTLLVAYQEMLYRATALTLHVDAAELAAIKASGKGVASWLMSGMKSLASAKEMTADIDELMLAVTAGDSVAAQRLDETPDYSADFIMRVLTVFEDSQTGVDEEEEE